MLIASRTLVVVLAVALVACGTKELSRQGFLDAVGRTCESANAKLEQVEQPSPAPEPSAQPTALAAFLAEALEISEDAAGAIRAMIPPGDLEGAHEQLLAAMDAANAGLTDAVDAAERSDEQAMTSAIAAMEAGRAEFERLVSSLQVDACRTLQGP